MLKKILIALSIFVSIIPSISYADKFHNDREEFRYALGSVIAGIILENNRNNRRRDDPVLRADLSEYYRTRRNVTLCHIDRLPVAYFREIYVGRKKFIEITIRCE